MSVYIHKSDVCGSVRVPSSKSLSHRALLAGLLSEEDCKIYNLLECDDTSATIAIINNLGKKVIKYDDYYLITKNEKYEENVLFANESGSTLRFIIPILSLFEGKHILTGTEKLLSRPLDIYKDIYSSQGLRFDLFSDRLEVEGKLKAGKYKVRGDISSQFITGLLYTLPLLDGDSIIEVTGNFESKSYVDLTIEVLNHFGVNIEYDNEKVFNIKGNQKFISKDYVVPGDYSQMAFWAVLGTINNDLIIAGMDPNSLQGDKAIIDILNENCKNVSYKNGEYLIKKADVSNLKIDLSMIPDLGPILGVLCSVSNGENKLYNASRLRYKESDRLAAIYDELSKMNINIKIINDSLIITNSGKDIVCLNEIDSHNDHRIFMASAILGTISKNGVKILNEKCINKSYPNFLRDLESLGVIIEYE